MDLGLKIRIKLNILLKTWKVLKYFCFLLLNKWQKIIHLIKLWNFYDLRTFVALLMIQKILFLTFN